MTAAIGNVLDGLNASSIEEKAKLNFMRKLLKAVDKYLEKHYGDDSDD